LLLNKNSPIKNDMNFEENLKISQQKNYSFLSEIEVFNLRIVYNCPWKFEFFLRFVQRENMGHKQLD
jgi:hypothetical protein